MRSMNSEYAVRSHKTVMISERMMAPMGSIHHLTKEPIMEKPKPIPLMSKSFL